MSFVDMLIPGLTFKKEELGKIGKDSNMTMISYIMTGLYIILTTLLSYYQKVIPPASGLSSLSDFTFGVFLALLFLNTTSLYLLILFIALSLKIFKYNAPFHDVLRVYAAVMIWDYIAFILSIFIDLSFAYFAFFLLLYIALMIGLAGYTDLKMWQTFLAIILGFLLKTIVNMLISNIFESLLS